MPTRRTATRDRLIRAAGQLLWERSFATSGVDDLCRLADAQKGSFYHFFPSKTALAVTTINARWTAMRDAVFETISTSGRPGLDRVTRLLTHLHAEQGSTEGVVLGCPFGHLAQEMAHQDADIRLAIGTILDEYAHYIERWLDEAVEDGQIPPADNRGRARQVLALVEGALLLAKVTGNPDEFARICAAVPAMAGRTEPSARRSMSGVPELD